MSAASTDAANEGSRDRDPDESSRLQDIYETLRLKLLDLTKKNRMLSYGLGARSQRHLQIVDEVLDEVYKKLANEDAPLTIDPLEEPHDLPAEETTEEFIAALEHAKVSNVEYLTELQALENTGRDDELALAKLERKLRDQVRKDLGLPPRPKKVEINRSDHARRLGINPNYELEPTAKKTSHRDLSLQTLKFPDELERTLGKIHADARLAEQEMGISTLFLAFGFLEWFDSDDSEKAAFAPLLLLPVQLEVRKIRGHNVYSLTATETSAEPNLSLQKLLETKFQRELPSFAGGDPTDEEDQPGSVEAYFDDVTKAIEGLPRWQVHRWLVLGHFAFGRFAVYADLDPAKWPQLPADHPLVGAILRGTDRLQGEDIDIGDPADYSIDEPDVERAAPYLVHDADASQHSAIVDVMNGENLVVQGPPGTGKSQTIANVIANALAKNKTVLFVAEKQAALEVVKRRLEKAGLGEFCLELHSDKASSKLVLESLAKRLRLRSSSPAPFNETAWRESKTTVGQYLQALHEPQPSGKTAFELIWKSLRGASQFDREQVERIDIPPDLLNSPERLEEVEHRVSIYADLRETYVQSFGKPALSPWTALGVGKIPAFRTSEIVEQLINLARSAKALALALAENEELGVTKPGSIRDLAAICARIGMNDAPPLVNAVASFDAARIEKALNAVEAIRQVSDALDELPETAEFDDGALQWIEVASQAPLPSIYLECPPAELQRIARDVVHRNTLLRRVIADCLPALQIFGSDERCSLKQVELVAKAVIASTQVPVEYRTAFSHLQGLDEAAFTDLKAKWDKLVESEGNWRSRFPAFGSVSWPSPSNLRSAAQTLSKSGVRKLLGTFGGSARASKDLLNSLGCGENDVSSKELLLLCDHIEALHRFERDDNAARTMGSRWYGLETKFVQISNAFRAKRFFVNQIGPNVADHLMKLSIQDVIALNKLKDAASQLLDVFQEHRATIDAKVDPAPLDMMAAEVLAMGPIVETEVPSSLADATVTTRQLGEIARLRSQKTRLSADLERLPEQRAAKELAETSSGLSDALAALKWLQTVRNEVASWPHLTRLSSSAKAIEAWNSLRQLVRLTSLDFEVYERASNVLLGEFGIGGIDYEDAAAVSITAEQLIAHRDELPDLIALFHEGERLAQYGLDHFLQVIDGYEIGSDRINDLFSAALAAQGARLARSKAGALQSNSGTGLEARRRQFAERDLQKIRSDRDRIKSLLLARKPEPGSNAGRRIHWTEMALIRHEMDKQKRFVPVRRLINQAGRSIRALKPCFMMSPLSLAKFIRAEVAGFDLLVIDEASQMRPEDAIGAMLRAKQIVVVGDPKQLPPTDFFSRSDDGSANDDGAEDLDDESILESCQKTFGKRRPLRWHYRSRCESLIRFSNDHFYQRGLITFPTAKPDSFAVDLIRVNGTFQASLNPPEASRVAEEAITFMRQYATADGDEIPSLGIVAINGEQRDLIQREVYRLTADDQLVEMYCDKVAARGESFFVKNLENVQGDERDFIFISMTYGPEPGSKMLKQRFGPINRKQGHRRLNVLFSRARSRIGLFVSFGSSDVVATPESSEGVRVLKGYLEYAETKGRLISLRPDGPDPDSDFETEVADRLRSRGFEVDYQVGVSGYRIDLGVRHPDLQGRYLAGIECDGARYHSSKSARDRDRIREEVLRDKGWDLLRVWSTDWFDNPGLQTDRLVEKLNELRKKGGDSADEYVFATDSKIYPDLAADEECEQGADQDKTPSIEIAEATVDSDQHDSAGRLTEAACIRELIRFRDGTIASELVGFEPERSILREAMIETFVRQKLDDPDQWFGKVPGYLRQGTNPVEKAQYLERICQIVARLTEQEAEEFRLSPETERPSHRQGQLPLGLKTERHRTRQSHAYAVTDFHELNVRLDAGRFYEAEYRPVLKAMIEHVLETEAPIYEELLISRIARAHGFQRAGGRIQDVIGKIIGRGYRKTSDDDRTILWSESSWTSGLVPFRHGDPDVRSHSDIPVVEIASLAASFLKLRLDDERTLYRLAEHFGLSRLREPTRLRFQAAIEVAKKEETGNRR